MTAQDNVPSLCRGRLLPHLRQQQLSRERPAARADGIRRAEQGVPAPRAKGACRLERVQHVEDRRSHVILGERVSIRARPAERFEPEDHAIQVVARAAG